MNIRCPGCGATAEYSPSDLKMICKHCGKIFSAYEATGKKKEEGKNKEDGKTNTKFQTDATKPFSKEKLREHATIKMRHFQCSACGAELMAKETEATSFCYYCGQPTVMEEQLEDYLEPDYIIPFKLTKEEAAETIKSVLKKAYYIPQKVKNFKIEKLTPIYVPYWLIDMEYEDHQYYDYKVKKNKYTWETKFASAEGKIRLDRYAVDGSLKLEDFGGQRIGPFDYSELEKFDPAYLSGYYADRFDVGTMDVEYFVNENVKEMFDWVMVEGVKKKSTHLYSSDPKQKIYKVDYALLPVWFLNMELNNRIFTILVNGQTGKVVYAIPPSWHKMMATFWGSFIGLTACMTPIIYAFMAAAMHTHTEVGERFVLYIPAIIVGLVFGSGCRNAVLARRKRKEYKRDLVRINGYDNVLYVKDRGTQEFQG
ncbi:MAG: hypothetical protein K6F31_07870 [Acetatifactor sp.]|nr:hypothetical protein [Acetatifactor sp.]